MNGELVRIGKVTVAVYSRYFPRICMEELRKTKKNTQSG
jgi:hypothetical protein